MLFSNPEPLFYGIEEIQESLQGKAKEHEDEVASLGCCLIYDELYHKIIISVNQNDL